MSESIRTSHNGVAYALLNGKALQSAFNPEKEAERYITSLNLSDSHFFFILFAPCVDYLSKALSKHYTGIDGITIQCSSFFTNPSFSILPSWSPPLETKALTLSLRNFLDEHLDTVALDSIRLILWPPAIKLYGDKASALLSQIGSYLREKKANRESLHYFGKRWFRNAISAFSRITHPMVPLKGSSPIVVVGSGPSLNDQLETIHNAAAQGVFIIAVSSSVRALNISGIIPDIIISSDGGYWAKPHLHWIGEAPLAATLYAALPSDRYEKPLLAISDGTNWQTYLSKQLSLPILSLPQRGTVSATAIDLSFVLTDGPIYLCGIDFKQFDLMSHAKPNTFDLYFENRANRLNALYTIAFERYIALNDADTLSIYANWLSTKLENCERPLFYLGDLAWPPKNLIHSTHIKPNYHQKPRFLSADLASESNSSSHVSFLIREQLTRILLEDSSSYTNYLIHQELLELLEPDLYLDFKRMIKKTDNKLNKAFLDTVNTVLLNHFEAIT